MKCALALLLIFSPSFGQELPQLNKAIGGFSVNLLKKNLKDSGNVIFSGFSISSALGMCLLGAKEQTQSQIQQVLGFADCSLEDVKEGYKQSSRSIAVMIGGPGSDAYIVSQANRLYANESQSPSEDFKEEVEDVFDAQIEVVSFPDQEATKEMINEFVKRQTRDLIPEFLEEPITPDALLVLVNALYFRGVWQKRMEKVNSTITFKGHSSDSGPPQWMNSTTMYKNGYSSELAATLVELPYAGNPNSTNSTSMVIIVPDNENITSWVDEYVTWEKIEEAIKGLQSELVQLTMPQFRIKSSFDLGATLADLGMVLAFSPDADFGNMYDDSVLATSVEISKVIHEAKISVDEKGTEAASATGVVIQPTAAIDGPAKPVIIDRPFLLFIILEGNGSRAPLFTALVNTL